MKKKKPTKVALEVMRTWGADSRAAIVQIDAALAILEPVSGHIAQEIKSYISAGADYKKSLSRDIGVSLRQARKTLKVARRLFKVLAETADETVEDYLVRMRQ